MVSMRVFAYGLTAAAAITGGTAIYYYSGETTGVTGDDIAELIEGINERYAAIQTAPFTGDSTNGWNFTWRTNMPSTPTHDIMNAIMDEIPKIATNYYQSSGVPWTASNLFIAAGIGPGDGRLLYTVAVTSGVPIYSNKMSVGVWTGLLFECKRGVSLLSITATKAPEWLPSDSLYWGGSNCIVYDTGNVYNITQPSTNDPPYWWDNILDITYFMTIGTNPTLTELPQVDMTRFTNSLTVAQSGQAGPARDIVTGHLTGWSTNQPEYSLEYPSIRWDESGGNRTYDPANMFVPYTEYQSSWANTGGVYVQVNLNTGVTASIHIPWSSTGYWVNIGPLSGSNRTDLYACGTSITTVACSGLTTGALSFVSATGILYRVSDLFDYSAEYAWPSFEWSGDEYGAGFYKKQYKMLPYPKLRGEVSAALPSKAWIHWNFTRCNP